MQKYREWENPFNPFNSYKIFKHYDHFKNIDIEKNIIPPPIAVTVDLTNRCNLNCYMCNASIVRDLKQDMNENFINDLPVFLKYWGVKAVTIAGGGEPLLHKDAGLFMKQCKRIGLKLGLITNGTLINNYHEEIKSCCDWVGVSVDSGTSEVWANDKLQGNRSVELQNLDYMKLINNIKEISGKVETTFKYLIKPDNIKDIYAGIKLAMECGCRQIHLRPVGNTWFNQCVPIFNENQVDLALKLIQDGKEDFENENFRVFGITHKFTKNWKPVNNFKTCYACLCYLVIQADKTISTCCDHRGFGAYDLLHGKNVKNLSDISNVWGSQKHIDLLKKIKVDSCPRCTLGFLNKTLENVIFGKEEMHWDFI